MRLGHDGRPLPRRAGRPRWVRPGHKWPDTNALTTPTNYHHPPCRLKASSTGAKVVPGGGISQRVTVIILDHGLLPKIHPSIKF